MSFFKRRFNAPNVENGRMKEEEMTLAESFWERKDISLKDIALPVGTAFLHVMVSFKIAEFLDGVIPSGEGNFHS
jgi:uncharacterized membrane protein